MDQDALAKFQTIVEEQFHGDIELFLHDLKSRLETANIPPSTQVVDTNREVLIKLRNISKTYKVGKEEVKALKNVSLDIYTGEVVALVGPSGSGKSTLLHLIGGLDTPDTGEITVDGADLHVLKDKDLSRYRNDTVGFVFQFFNLQQYLNVAENVEVPLIFRGQKKSERTLAAVDAVKAVGLEERISHLPKQLSGGQMQRVAIARALVNKPKIILADEPTGNLDRNTGVEIIELIKKLNRELNTTIIIVTHDTFIAQKADRIIKLTDGEIL